MAQREYFFCCLHSLFAYFVRDPKQRLLDKNNDRSNERTTTESIQPTSRACLVRSAQPLSGVTGARCAADERLMNLYRCYGAARLAGAPSHHQQQQYLGRHGIDEAFGGAADDTSALDDAMKSSHANPFEGDLTALLAPLYIFDCRGAVAATGNSLQGKGVENVRHYTNATLK